MSVSALRVTGELVKEIFTTNLGTSELVPYILIAHQLIEDHLINKGLSAGTLFEIERLLAAHFASSMTEGTITREDFGKGEYTVDYSRGVLGEGLKSTPFGQGAIALDSTGILSRISAPRAQMQMKFR